MRDAQSTETELRARVDRLIASGRTTLDLVDQDDLQAVAADADGLLLSGASPEAYAAIEAALAGSDPAAPLTAQVACKLAHSKCVVGRLSSPAFVSIVFAVYKETVRVLTRDEHPHGEDFLRRKVRQVEWLAEANPAFDWEIVVVDDGCPDGSGDVVQRVAEREGYGDRVRVLHLERAIQDRLPVVSTLASTDHSRKGGAIQLGMWEAVNRKHRGHVVLFTDADLSTHLGQIGLLLEPLADGCLAAVGSRREATSVVVKGSGRNDRGKLFIYLWKRMLRPLGEVVDTQCGFKAFAAGIVDELVHQPMERQFAFDIEFMLRTELIRPGSIARVPIAWIDSEALSTTTDLQPYLAMLKSAAAMYRRYLPRDDEAEAYASFIESLDEDAWQRLLTDIPEAITARDPASFGTFRDVSVHDLRAHARPR